MTYTLSAAARHARPPSLGRAGALLLAVTLSGLAACGGADSGTGPSNDGQYGEYELQQVDGAALPVQVHNGPFLDRVRTRFYNNLKLRVTGGEVHLHDDGNFYMALELSGVGDGEAVDTTSEFEAFYKAVNGELTVVLDGKMVRIGTVQDGEVTVGLDLMGKGVFNQYTFRR